MKTKLRVEHGTAEYLELTIDGVHSGEVRVRIGSSWAVVDLDTLASASVELRGIGTRPFEYASASYPRWHLPKEGLPAAAMKGCDVKFWRRNQRQMPKHGWRYLKALGLTEGGAIVMLAVPR